jgi:GR25 family glycosyltransferase involved in LPS biosynthesis
MKSFIIHLSKIESSLKTAISVKDQLNKFEMEAELFEGSYGNEVKELFKSQNRVCHPWTFKGPNRLLGDDEKNSLSAPGVMGCFYSHYRLWKKCVELNESIMIFEDDVTFSRPFIPVEWDEVLILVFGSVGKSARYYEYLTNPSGEPKAMDYFQASMPGTPGYAIKPEGAKKLVNMYKNTFLPSDNAINTHVIKIQIHNYIMGRALLSSDGKKSLVRHKNNFWENFKK